MDDYDGITAAHYAAYRPPLHGPILQELLGKHRYDGAGLDVGCGTGQSALALSGYCRYVFGIDPSAEMLALTPEHPSVEFRQQTMTGLAQQLPGTRFALVSFAGSLFYQEAAEVALSFPDLLAAEATVVVYDFDVDFTPAFRLLGFAPPAGDYDHRCGFDAYLKHGLSLEKEWSGKLSFPASPLELAHLICSVTPWREVLLRGSSFADIETSLRLRSSAEDRLEVSAAAYGKVYSYRATL